MRYVVSDIHGEYTLFKRLLQKLDFSDRDEMIVCGDIIDKGESSVALAQYISSLPNVRCIVGNHEYAFLQYYHSLLEASPNDFDAVLKQLQAYFPEDGHLLDWDLVDYLEGLPAYIEEADFICVHAGIPLDPSRRLLPLSEVSVERLVNDRKFKDPAVLPKDEKCVFFGHTQTDCICGESKILGYRRNSRVPAASIRDYYKIHLDTGSWSNGVLGCFCIDTLKAVYVKKD